MPEGCEVAQEGILRSQCSFRRGAEDAGIPELRDAHSREGPPWTRFSWRTMYAQSSKCNTWTLLGAWQAVSFSL